MTDAVAPEMRSHTNSGISRAAAAIWGDEQMTYDWGDKG
jgi:hypothetical protein